MDSSEHVMNALQHGRKQGSRKFIDLLETIIQSAFLCMNSLNPSILKSLEAIVGTQEILTQKEDLIPYYFHGTAALKGLPGCVAFTHNSEQVSGVLKLAKEHQLKVGTFGHIGDGNLHSTFLTDERNESEMHRTKCAFEEIFKEAIQFGGTITGEHGIGIAKKHFLPDFAGEVQMRVLKEVRRAFDSMVF